MNLSRLTFHSCTLSFLTNEFLELSLSLSHMLRPTVSLPVCLGMKHPLGACEQIFFLLSESCVFLDVGRSLWREDGSVVYNCCWPSPARSFSGPSSVGLVTMFCSLRFETSFFFASYDTQGYGGGIRPRLHTGFLSLGLNLSLAYNISARTM
jgi:hypothetical protein